MVVERIVVGAGGDDSVARTAARRLRDEGHEVIFVGGHQTPDQVVSAAVAEDADRIVLDAAPQDVRRATELCEEVGAGDISVGPPGAR